MTNPKFNVNPTKEQKHKIMITDAMEELMLASKNGHQFFVCVFKDKTASTYCQADGGQVANMIARAMLRSPELCELVPQVMISMSIDNALRDLTTNEEE